MKETQNFNPYTCIYHRSLKSKIQVLTKWHLKFSNGSLLQGLTFPRLNKMLHREKKPDLKCHKNYTLRSWESINIADLIHKHIIVFLPSWKRPALGWSVETARMPARMHAEPVGKSTVCWQTCFEKKMDAAQLRVARLIFTKRRRNYCEELL